MRETTPIEGELPKPRLWQINKNGERLRVIAEADTVEELKKRRRRFDMFSKIYVGNKPIDL